MFTFEVLHCEILMRSGWSKHCFTFVNRQIIADTSFCVKEDFPKSEKKKKTRLLDCFVFVTISFQDLHKDVEIKAANGKSLRAVTVFAHALRFFKDHVLEELSDQSATKILEEDIQWVLTVPAIWKAPAKQFMRTAAYEVSGF